MPGLLVNKQQIPVQGLAIINPNDADWCRLAPKDCAQRSTSWVRQIILHTTKGGWPQDVRAGRGGGSKARRVADMWRGDSSPSGAHIVIDNDGTVACLCDLATTIAYHATVSNAWSIGVEMYQESGNGIHAAVYDAAVKLVPALCRIFGIQFQIPKLPYRGAPLRRMIDGGKLCVGVFGHRDNTERRGRGDPGDEIFVRLAQAGAESFDHDAGEDLEVWKARQAELNQRGAELAADGVPGPATVAALRAAGRGDGIWALG
jgi:N-acetylmuramoyl-L-alanine amidase